MKFEKIIILRSSFLFVTDTLNANIGLPYATLVLTKVEFESAVRTHFRLGKDAFVLASVGATCAIDQVVGLVESKSARRVALIPLPEYWRAVERISASFKVVFVRPKSGVWNSTSDLVRHVKNVKPDLLYLSHPNNPTGNLYDLQKIVAALSKNTTLVVDTTLFGVRGSSVITSDDVVRTLVKAGSEKRVVIVGSLSKTHGPVGVDLRCGWIITGNAELGELLFRKNLTFPSSRNLSAGLRLLGKKYDVGFVRNVIASHGLLCLGSKKGRFEYIEGDLHSPYGLVRLPAKRVDLVKKIFEKENIIVAWGPQVGLAGNYVRIELGNSSLVRNIVNLMNSA
jgi:histidinol-phosphate/aromatic aminotransferase/cobyric acid decarboxylase-like protein